MKFIVNSEKGRYSELSMFALLLKRKYQIIVLNCDKCFKTTMCTQLTICFSNFLCLGALSQNMI